MPFYFLLDMTGQGTGVFLSGKTGVDCPADRYFKRGHDRAATCRFSKGNGGKPCRKIGDVRCAAWPAERDALAYERGDQIQGTKGSDGLCGIDGFQCRCA